MGIMIKFLVNNILESEAKTTLFITFDLEVTKKTCIFAESIIIKSIYYDKVLQAFIHPVGTFNLPDFTFYGMFERG